MKWPRPRAVREQMARRADLRVADLTVAELKVAELKDGGRRTSVVVTHKSDPKADRLKGSENQKEESLRQRGRQEADAPKEGRLKAGLRVTLALRDLLAEIVTDIAAPICIMAPPVQSIMAAPALLMADTSVGVTMVSVAEDLKGTMAQAVIMVRRALPITGLRVGRPPGAIVPKKVLAITLLIIWLVITVITDLRHITCRASMVITATMLAATMVITVAPRITRQAITVVADMMDTMVPVITVTMG